MKKLLLIIIFFIPSLVSAQYILQGPQGGTNISTGVSGDVNKCLKVLSVNPLKWSVGTCGSTGGSGSDVNWTLFNGSGLYPSTTTNQVLIGDSSTTTRASLEIRALTTTGGSLTSLGSTTLQNFTFLNATGTRATTTSFAISNIISSLLKTNSTGGILAAVSGTDYEVPLTFSTGLTRSVNTVTVNSSQNIATLSNLTGNGFVKTSGGTGALSIDTNTYLTGNQSISLTGDVTGSGATSIASTLATVNSNVGAFTNANITVNAKGLITAASNGSGGSTASSTLLSDNNSWTGNNTFARATTTSLGITGVVSTILKTTSTGGVVPAVAGTDFTLITAATCTGTDKVSSVSASGVVTCSADQNSGGGGGSETNWNFFNGSGVRLGTTTNQVLIGASSTTTTATLEVRGTNGIFANGSSTLASLTTTNSTSTNATTTTFAISSSQLHLLPTGILHLRDGELHQVISMLLTSATSQSIHSAHLFQQPRADSM